ncbi:MAG: neutral/alkaline non-lysosomal ceramidase N-terminal domain-containing protein [Pirellulaceae bacterium]
MSRSDRNSLARRSFLKHSLRSAAALGLSGSAIPLFASPTSPDFSVGEGVVDTTVPNGVELAGFHRVPGNERVATGVREGTASRAIVIRSGETKFALVSLDVICVSPEFTQRVAARVGKEAGIPPQNVHITATHTHSAPTFVYLRQWGKIPTDYMTQTEDAVVKSIVMANADLTPAELFYGQAQAQGANFNRTTKDYKTDAQFDQTSTDDQRWLDTLLQTLRFQRAGGKPDVIWYHFSSHPVCYTDSLSGPDWVGMVRQHVKDSEGVEPGFLQGHAGDVNPGDGTKWIGAPEPSADATYAAVKAALASSVSVPVKELKGAAGTCELPLDNERLKRDLETYRQNPAACGSGVWVDPPFAADWYSAAKDWSLTKSALATPMSTLALGPIGLLFHPAELYSFYGLQIRHASPFEQTLVVGFTDHSVGYVTDPNAYQAEEYAAIVVPKILDLPYYTPNAGRSLAATAGEMLQKLAS